MARVKEYDRERVLQKAVTVFWAKGFEAASMADLVKATGLNTFSMYREFGSKEGFFEAALGSYRQTVMLKALQRVIEEPGLSTLSGFIYNLASAAAQKDYKGCLHMNSLAEQEVVSKEATARVKGYCVEVKGIFESAIRAAQREGKIDKRKDAKVLANYLFCFVQGLTLYGRTSNDGEMIKKMVDTVMKSMEG